MKLRQLLIVVCLLLLAPAAMAAELRVVTEEGLVRKDRRFFAPVVTRVPYGELIRDDSRRGDWFRVRYQGIQGWIHKSQVTERKYRATLTGPAPEATRDEVALAGKGFTPDVERSYRGQNPRPGYEAVARVEAYRVSDEALQSFIRSGKLQVRGGEP